MRFLRRFLLHVLPRGFVRIRHFGKLPLQPSPRSITSTLQTKMLARASFTTLCMAAHSKRRIEAVSALDVPPMRRFNDSGRATDCPGPDRRLRSPPAVVTV